MARQIHVALRRGEENRVCELVDRARAGEQIRLPRVLPVPVRHAPGVLGIDPGNSGGLVLVTDQRLTILPMPTIKDQVDRDLVDGRAVHQWIQSLGQEVAKVVIERVHSRPSDGHVGAFSFGRGYGVLLGVCSALGLVIEEVTPGQWMPVMLDAVTKSDWAGSADLEPGKERQGWLCTTLWPAVDWPRAPRHRRFLDGVMDAALLAEYGRRQLAAGGGR